MAEVNKDEILIREGNWNVWSGKHECSVTARVKHPNVLGGFSTYSPIAPVVIKVITERALGAGASAPTWSSAMTTATGGKNGGKSETRMAYEFVRSVAAKQKMSPNW